MQEINWGNFIAKFNGKEQKSFEWLCYLLFCYEFKRTTGISRYLNQAGIETDPIEVNGKWIGWQAKFYTTALSNHKDDFITSIETSKAKHSGINKIIFYTNQDFAQGRKKNDPQYKLDIEKHAEAKGITIVWKTASFFESPFVCVENANIAQHFFSLGKSAIDFIGELKQHTETILNPIHSKIIFNDSEIKIDRTHATESIKALLSKSSILILSGEAGVGKTAVIKDFYCLVKETTPFFVFKATEFNISNINQLFNGYGNFTLSDFIKEHEKEAEKYIIVDSAEKLSDINHQEVFQEFLSSLIENNWKIIFTTRYSYLDDLKYQVVEVFNLSFRVQAVDNLTKKELDELSRNYHFTLPSNDRLRELLHNPFYLNDYLRNYQNLDTTVSYSDFKTILWNKQILNSVYRKNNAHIKREDCFLNIAQKRANTGQFFVKVDECNDEILQKLELDEIIKYDSNAGGYFITHDIYEEWALDKVVERAFHNSRDYQNFYQNIGSSLPIRRAFRNWLSERLYHRGDVTAFIESNISDDRVENYWKDEVLVSVLLSDYSENFFRLFEGKLLDNDQALLIKCIFLLRLACKEIDESLLNLLGLKRPDGIALKTLFTKPKGTGWIAAIDFINKHKKEFGLRHIDTILPLLNDWNNKNKEGKATKNAAQTALFYYDEITKDDRVRFGSHNETKNLLINILLNGCFEIKGELAEIINNALSNNEIDHRSQYYDLFHTILSSVTDTNEIAKNLPEQVISLADIYWFQNPDEEGFYSRGSLDLEQYYCISPHHMDYFPSSAFQTPILNLLRFAPKQTVDFILSFTNKTVECYSKSKLDKEVEEVVVFIDEAHSIKQHISDRLWKTYRGTHVSTHLLESMHMALERWLLEVAKTTSKDIIESWCSYLLRNSKSASITAVVMSVVFSQPSKLFYIATILFNTKLFFLYDKTRWISDRQHKSSLIALRDNFGGISNREIFENERINACDDKHRQYDLEYLAVYYQFFMGEEDSEDEFRKKQEIIWGIFDKYYKELPNITKETDKDKTWRLFLARMDRRKMHPEVEDKDGQVLISFNPEIEPELKKFSEDSTQKSSAALKHTPLLLWSTFRFKKDESKYKQYQQYEENPQAVISETREIIEEFKSLRNEDYVLLNRSIPAFACSVLVRDYFDQLNSEDREFCKSILIEIASLPLRFERYQYQVSDGTEPAIISLPYLLNYFPNDKEEIKSLLFLLLLNPRQEIPAFVTRAILDGLWGINSEDAHSIFIGYLLLKPKYDDMRAEARKKKHNKRVFVFSESQVIEKFINKYEAELEKLVSNTLAYDDIDEFTNKDIGILNTAFELLPINQRNQDHEKFLTRILPIFAERILSKDSRSEYTYNHRFMEKFAYLVLMSPKTRIRAYLEPFSRAFGRSRDIDDFFAAFVSAEDRLRQYDEFWIVWEAFYEKIVALCKTNDSNHFSKAIVHTYLLAWPWWKENAKEWHSLKEREKAFFNKVAHDIGHHPSVLYSLSKILNDIGSNFIEDGISWISSIFQRNGMMSSVELDTNTVYYIESLARKHIFTKRQKIKKSSKLKNQVIIILDFLIERGSATGYLLREDIL
jgi:hypothetical protein